MLKNDSLRGSKIGWLCDVEAVVEPAMVGIRERDDYVAFLLKWIRKKNTWKLGNSWSIDDKTI